MDRIKFQVDGYLVGGLQIEEEDIETITDLDCYEELISFIEEGNKIILDSRTLEYVKKIN